MVKISIVVPMFNAESCIEEALKALLSQTYPRDKYEIIVIDNGSWDRSAEIVSNYPVRLLFEDKHGSYAARNMGIEHANARVIAFTDADCIASCDWLESIEKALSEQGVQIVLGHRQNVSKSYLAGLLEKYEDTKHQHVFSSDRPEIYYGHTNNMGVLRSLFDTIGKFPEIKRGGDTIFVRKVVDTLGHQSVGYDRNIKVKHKELNGIFNYYKKNYVYSYHRQKPHPTNVATLTNKDRWKIFIKTAQRHSLNKSHETLLLMVLGGGVCFWYLGVFLGKWNFQFSK